MSIQQPTGTSLLNAPSHSKAHRVWGWDDSAPDKSTQIQADGHVVFQYSPWIDVKSFGDHNTGDGTQDDTIVIGSAISSVPSSGATIFFPPGHYRYNGLMDLASTGKKIKLLGVSYFRDQLTTQLEFIHTDGTTNCINMGGYCALEKLNIWGSGTTGHGIYVDTGGCHFRDIDVRHCGNADHDSIYIHSHINEFYNCNFNYGKRDNIHIEEGQENRFYSCKAPFSGRYDIYLGTGIYNNHNYFDIDVGDGGGTYSIYIERGAGNKFWNWHDGGTDKIAYFGTTTANNFMRYYGAANRMVDDYGVNNDIENTADVWIHTSFGDTFENLKNWVRDSSFVNPNTTNGWWKQSGVTMTRVVGDGVSTQTCGKITFPQNCGAAYSNGAYQRFDHLGFSYSAGDIIVISFWAKLDRDFLSATEGVYVHIIGSTAVNIYPTSGGPIGKCKDNTSWKKYTYVMVAYGDSPSQVQIHFRGWDTNNGTDLNLYITDLMVIKNPRSDLKRLPYISTGYTDKYIHYVRDARQQQLPTQELSILDAIPPVPLPGAIAIADGDNWDPINKSNAASYLVHYGQVNLNATGIYKWTANGLGGANEYLCELNAGGDPSWSGKPDEVYIAGTVATEGTCGTLLAQYWGWGTGTGNWNTVHVRLADGTDPDTKADGYFLGRKWAQIGSSCMK